MSNSIYIQLSGLVARQNEISTLADNLANTTSIGYKGSVANFSSFVKQNKPSDSHFVYDSNVWVNNSAGQIKSTKSPFDLAILGEKFFFAIQTPEGIRYTRNGNFMLDSNGFLVTANNAKVLDENNEAINFQDDEKLVSFSNNCIFCNSSHPLRYWTHHVFLFTF
jgi:flagellar hook-basal body protein